MRFFIATTVLTTLGLASACGGSASNTKVEHADATPAPSKFSEQVARGAEVYGERCAGCHGKAGQGSDGAPAVVGPTALPLEPPSTSKFRKQRFVTVADVADFVTKNMPPNAPGTLSADDYFSVLAFDLKANGIDLGDQKLDAALAAGLTIPRK